MSPFRAVKMLSRIKDPPDLFALLLVEPLRPLVMGALADAPLPPPLAAVKRIPELLSSVTAKVNLTSEPEIADRVGASQLPRSQRDLSAQHNL